MWIETWAAGGYAGCVVRSGARLGVLVLDTRFERVPGDIGSPETFRRAEWAGSAEKGDRAPVLFRTVPGATVARVIGRQDGGLVDLFAAHAAALAAEGATAITTSCGFMARHQTELAARIPVPFASSALCLLGALQERYGVVGVITADSTRLTSEHFTACGAVPPDVGSSHAGPSRGGPADSVVAGMQGKPAFRAAILDQTAPLDPERIRAEVLEVGAELIRAHPEVRALLLECTNLPPYAPALAEASGLPVFDALTLCHALMSHSASLEGANIDVE
ncbi:hypothetical protein [Brevibacterium salitolerans]|uniref:Aspartate/glutamate racemase family protein n=1 Tax=Brevibacterium salitolerans TaxID=1403566 RepID=A0ABP5IET8_9MICO